MDQFRQQLLKATGPHPPTLTARTPWPRSARRASATSLAAWPSIPSAGGST